MNKDFENTSAFFSQFAEFSASLSKLSLAIYTFEFHYLAFGSWVLTAGQRKKRWRFCRDGKEFLLSASVGDFPDSGTAPDWVAVFESKLPNSSSAQPLDEVLKFLTNEIET